MTQKKVEIDKSWINYARNQPQRFVLKTNVNVKSRTCYNEYMEELFFPLRLTSA